MKYHGICNRVFQKNTLNTIADDTNSAGDKIHPNADIQSHQVSHNKFVTEYEALSNEDIL